MTTFSGLRQIGTTQVTNAGTTSNDADGDIVNALANPRAETVDNTNAFTITNVSATWLWERNIAWRFTDAGSPPTAQITVTVPATPARALFAVINATSQDMAVEITSQPLTAPVIKADEAAVLSNDGTNVELLSSGAGGTFLDLSDTPASYSGQGGKAVAVNPGATAIEFKDFPAGAGDALPFTLSPAYKGALASLAADITAFNGTTPAAIAFDAEEYDTDSFHDNATNNTRITIPAGVTKARFTGVVSISSFVGAETFEVSIRKNGGAVPVGMGWTGNEIGRNSARLTVVSQVIDVAEGDYFELYVFIETDASITIESENTCFGIEVIETTDAVPSLRTVVAALRPKHRGAKARPTSDLTGQNYTAVGTVTLGTAFYDTDNIFNDTNDSLVVPAGVTKVIVRGALNMLANFPGIDGTLLISKNGDDNWVGNPRARFDPSTTTTLWNAEISTGVIIVSPGDEFRLRAFMSSDTTVDVESDNTWLEMEIVEFASSTDAPVAYIAVPPEHKGALLARSATHSIPDAAEETIPWQTATYDTSFDPGDGGPPQRFWLGVNTSFVDGDVSVANDEITETAHGYQTGEGPVRLTTTGTLPAGLATGTNYWIIRVDANTYKFATSRANALAGTDVDITAAAGGGTHTVNHEEILVVPANVAKVRLHGSVRLLGGTTPVNRYLTIHKNGAGVQGALPTAVDDGDQSSWLHAHTNVLEVSEGDRFSLVAFQNSAGAVNVSNNEGTNFSIEVIEESRAITYPGVTVTPPWRGAETRVATTITGVDANEVGGGYAIAWDTEVEDTDGFWAVSPNPTRFTIPAGLGIKRVKLSASVVTNNVAVNEFGELRIKKNGTDTQGLPITRDFENSNIDRRFSVHSGPVSVSDGDYFEVFWLTETDTSTDIANSTYTWFKIEVVETDQNAFPPEQIHFFQHGAPGVSDVLFMKVLNRRTTVNDALAGSEAYALGGANGGAVVYDVKRNGTKIGDVTFANTTGAAAAGTFATQAAQQYVFAVGDRLTIESPANVQSMTDISFNLAGFRS